METSSALRQLAADRMNQSGEEYLRRHGQHGQRLDHLAGGLQTLHLWDISHKVGAGPPGLSMASLWPLVVYGLLMTINVYDLIMTTYVYGLL